MCDWAIIFDVDGVLLELTSAEEELFFQPFARRIDADVLSRDWNSYKIRNDEEIVKEIVARYGLPPIEAAMITREYLALLEGQLALDLKSEVIAGADQLLKQLRGKARLGIATANFRKAAELRLTQAGLWPMVSSLAHGADGGGAKAEILARAIAEVKLPRERIIFIGDNLNDVEAGLRNGVHFIGFSVDANRRSALAQAGAKRLAAQHDETTALIENILGA
ncbi:HAD family hydrolase [Aestuariivirga litoralis]|uniref:HAD family hydrolase n=1 Tax=Aestuariivirga litoralis TaxID=2650924 RepID=UPI0018C6BF6A|nr:HAD-IA family hydrolase [Aestuariivirga litoralis]